MTHDGTSSAGSWVWFCFCMALRFEPFRSASLQMEATNEPKGEDQTPSSEVTSSVHQPVAHQPVSVSQASHTLTDVPVDGMIVNSELHTERSSPGQQTAVIINQHKQRMITTTGQIR